MNSRKIKILAKNIMGSEFKAYDYFKILAEFWQAEFTFSFELIDMSLESPKDFAGLKEIIHKSAEDFLVIDEELSDLLMAQFPNIPSEVREIGLADGLLRQANKYWPRNMEAVALHELIIETLPNLDTHSIAYVTGSTGLSQMCISLAIKLGFQNVVVISEDAKAAMARVEAIKKLFFNININVLDDTELTLQPNNGSILFNCLGAGMQASLFNDLTYLNFISKKGLVIHLPFSTEENDLINEAQHVGIASLAGVKILARRDYNLLNFFKKPDLDFNSYLEKWIYTLRLVSSSTQQEPAGKTP